MGEQLEYARLDLPRRYSKLAILSLVISLLASPFVTGPLVRAARGFSIGLDQTKTLFIVFTPPIVAFIFALVSAVRLHRRRDLKGMGIALASMAIGAVWLLCLGAALLTMGRLNW